MAVIVDGYNLLNASGVFAPADRPQTLEAARRALLDYLADHLAAERRAEVQIVFDAKQKPPGVGSCYCYRGLTVRYASGYQEADDLIEELIAADTAPRQLTVVSSDRRLQRAARRRRAKAVDSDVWLRRLEAGRYRQAPSAGSDKPQPWLSEAEVAHWVSVFAQSAPAEKATGEDRRRVARPKRRR